MLKPNMVEETKPNFGRFTTLTRWVMKLIKKGDMDTETGFIVDEPFYFRSKLPMQRVIECAGASNATLKKWANNRKAQKWRFDSTSKTIRNLNWTSYVLNQEGANLRCRTMNSRWF
jgi:hypothetical protein